MGSHAPKKTLVIDCQVFQTASWHRGMGKYSYALLDAMFRNKNIMEANDLVFVVTDKIELQPEVRAFLNKNLVNPTILELPLEVPRQPRTEHSIDRTIEANKRILTDQLGDKLGVGQFDFLILALYLDEVCPVFPDNAAEKMVIYYDAIPYLYYERYNLFKGFFDNFYFPHTATIYEATKLLSISETVANDLCIIFGMPNNRITNINGAAIERENIQSAQPNIEGIAAGAYILMPTGQELRKNNKRAVQGFADFKQHHPESDLKLVVTSNFTDEGRVELTQITPEVVFTGNVSEPEIKWLFDNCKFLLFPSEYEGLGLPILEAVDSKKQIACSNISVFREISTTAFTFFDPQDYGTIATALAKVDSGLDLPDIDKEYSAIKQKYTWDQTVSLLEPIMTARPTQMQKRKKRKIAVFCPDASGFSAIGKVVTECHARYSEYFDVTYYFDHGPNHRSIRPNPLPALAPCYNAEDFTAEDYDKFDAIVYHIGNSEYHLNIIHTALAFPGYVILHDTFLAGAYQNLFDLGYISQQRYNAEMRLDELLQGGDTDSRVCNFLSSIVNNQLGVITHSSYAKKAVEGVLLDKSYTKVRKVNLPVSTPMFPDITRPQRDKTVISFAGIIASVKGTAVMEDIAKSERYDKCLINIFGYSAVEPEQLERLKMLPHVNLVTNPSDYAFQELMASTDILINVRLAYKGETSLTTLEAMRFGGVAVVRDFGWYSELHDDTVIKVGSPDDTLGILEELVDDKARRDLTGKRALEYIQKEHTHDSYAAELYRLIDKVNTK